MSICLRNIVDMHGEQDWNGWASSYNMDDDLVQFCRDVFGKRYRRYWVYPVYMDDRYMRFTSKFFREVGVELLPKISSLPDAPRPPKGKNPYNHRGRLVHPNCPNLAEWDKWRIEMEEYRGIVWAIVWGDYRLNISEGKKPIRVVIKGVRTPKEKEHILGVERVKTFSVLEQHD